MFNIYPEGVQLAIHHPDAIPNMVVYDYAFGQLPDWKNIAVSLLEAWESLSVPMPRVTQQANTTKDSDNFQDAV